MITELVNNYIKPYIWEGTLLLDGGTAAQDKVIKKYGVRDPILGIDPSKSFYITPISDVIVGNEEDSFAQTHINKRFSVIIFGEDFKNTFKKLEDIASMGKSKCEISLQSYFKEKAPEKGTDIYRLHILMEKNKKPVVTVIKGNWAPSFVKAKPVASWEHTL